jgi:hypothetical protein
MVNDQVDHGVKEKIGTCLAYFTVIEFDLFPKGVEDIPGGVFLETDHKIFSKNNADLLGFNGRIGFIKVQHVEQAENDAVDLIGLGPLAMAQDIFNDQRVDTKMVADFFHVPFPDTVHIDPGNTIGIEVWITLFRLADCQEGAIGTVVIIQKYLCFRGFFPDGTNGWVYLQNTFGPEQFKRVKNIVEIFPFIHDIMLYDKSIPISEKRKVIS